MVGWVLLLLKTSTLASDAYLLVISSHTGGSQCHRATHVGEVSGRRESSDPIRRISRGSDLGHEYQLLHFPSLVLLASDGGFYFYSPSKSPSAFIHHDGVQKDTPSSSINLCWGRLSTSQLRLLHPDKTLFGMSRIQFSHAFLVNSNMFISAASHYPRRLNSPPASL